LSTLIIIVSGRHFSPRFAFDPRHCGRGPLESLQAVNASAGCGSIATTARQVSERRDAVADVGADVEYEIARFDELGIETVFSRPSGCCGHSTRQTIA